jgi:LCP family protein required for cell wall assembly
MPDDRQRGAPPKEPPEYRVYRSGDGGSRESGRGSRESARGSRESGRESGNAPSERPYTVYRAAPRGLRARLRGEEEIGLPEPGRDGGGGRRRWWRRRGDDLKEPRRITPLRVLKYVAIAIASWLLLSLILFMISAQKQSGSLPASAKAALTSGGNMLTSADTVLVIGTDQRPVGSKEPGAHTSDAGSRSDTIMLWRIGGGVSRRLSIPRDTVASIPGHGVQKINAAYAFGGPALAVQTVEQFTGVKINHLIVVNLANFPKFIDAIGGIDVQTPRICSDISGGTKNGGFSLNLAPGTHHLNGRDALTLARTRHNNCNPAENDLTRVKRQQQVLNGIKSKLLSPSAFFHLPWAAWDAPQVLRTDMGGFTLLSLFAASEIGGSAPVNVLKPTGAQTLPDGSSALTVSPGELQNAVTKLMKG